MANKDLNTHQNIIDLQDNDMLSPQIIRDRQVAKQKKSPSKAKKITSMLLIKILDIQITKGERVYKTVWTGESKIQSIKWVKLKDLVDQMPMIVRYESENKQKIESLQKEWNSRYNERKVREKLNKTNLQAWRQIIIEEAEEYPCHSQSQFECKPRRIKTDKHKKAAILSYKGLKNKRIYKPSKKYIHKKEIITSKPSVIPSSPSHQKQDKQNKQPIQPESLKQDLISKHIQVTAEPTQPKPILINMPFKIILPYQQYKPRNYSLQLTAEKTIASQRKNQSDYNDSQQAKCEDRNSLPIQSSIFDSQSPLKSHCKSHYSKSSEENSSCFLSFESEEPNEDFLQSNLNFQKLKQMIMEKYVPGSKLEQNNEAFVRQQEEAIEIENQEGCKMIAEVQNNQSLSSNEGMSNNNPIQNKECQVNVQDDDINQINGYGQQDDKQMEQQHVEQEQGEQEHQQAIQKVHQEIQQPQSQQNQPSIDHNKQQLIHSHSQHNIQPQDNNNQQQQCQPQKQHKQQQDEADGISMRLVEYISKRIISGCQMKEGYHPKVEHIRQVYEINEVQFLQVVIKDRYNLKQRFVEWQLMEYYYGDELKKWKESIVS